MPTLKELEAAFIKADDAGNTEDAAAFAAEIRRLRAEGSATAATKPQASPRVDTPAPTSARDAITQGLLGNTYGINPAQFGDTMTMEMLADAGLEGGGAAIGQAVGGMAPGPFKPAGMVAGRVLGGVGGNYLAQKRRVAMGEQDGIKPGQLVGAGVSALLPGGSLTKAPVWSGIKSGAANLAAAGAETAIDQGRLPTEKEAALVTGFGAIAGAAANRFMPRGVPTAEEALYAKRNSTFNALRKEGVVLPPHELERGSDIVSSIGGKAALQQRAAKKNQFVWQRLAREELGLKGALPLMDDEIEAVRKRAHEPYIKLQQISRDAKEKLAEYQRRKSSVSGSHDLALYENDPSVRAAMDPQVVRAAADVDALKIARAKAVLAYRRFKGGDPAAHKEWEAAKFAVEKLNRNIDEAAKAIGDDGLLKRLNEARTTIAKTYDLQDAINPTTGLIDPAELGRKVERREPLSGNLKKIGDFWNAFHREAIEATRVPSPNVNNLNTQITAATASQNTAPSWIAAATQATAGKPIRSLLLSEPVQNSFLSPRLKSPGGYQIPEAFRLGSMAASRNVFLNPVVLR